MREGMRQVKEKRATARSLDEANCLVRIAFGKRGQIDRRLNNIRVMHQDRGRLVIAIRNAIILVEAAVSRKVRRRAAQMPFADAHCLIPGRLQHLRDSNFIQCKST